MACFLLILFICIFCLNFVYVSMLTAVLSFYLLVLRSMLYLRRPLCSYSIMASRQMNTPCLHDCTRTLRFPPRIVLRIIAMAASFEAALTPFHAYEVRFCYYLPTPPSYSSPLSFSNLEKCPYYLHKMPSSQQSLCIATYVVFQSRQS